MRKIALFLFLLILAIQVIGQSRAKAMKFDEFSDPHWTNYYPYREFGISDRIRRYTRAIRKIPNSKAYIIYYHSRQTNEIDKYKIDNLASQSESELRNIRGFSEKNVITIDGGFREYDTIEYWIVEKGAEPPKPMPTVSKAEAFLCPSIYVYANGFYFDKSKPVRFSTRITDGFGVTYKWKISKGEIVSGQDTPSVIVDTSKSDSETLTAVVEIEGLKPTCNQVAMTTIKVGMHPYLFDETDRYLYSDLHARIDAFMIAINDNPELTGHIIAYAGRSEGRVEIDRAVASIKRIFLFRRYSYDRIKVVDGGYREFNSVEMWLLPKGVDPPQPKPTVDPKFIKVTKRRVDFGER